jgi:hypothetical protein
MFVVVPSIALAQCNEECYHIQFGTQHVGYACVQGSDGDSCQAGQQHCYIELCPEPLLALNDLGLPMLLIQTCSTPALQSIDFDVPVVEVDVDAPASLPSEEAVTTQLLPRADDAVDVQGIERPAAR